MKSLNKSFFAFVIIGAVVATFVAHYDEYLPYSWQLFESPDGAFSLSLPGKARMQDGQAPLANGQMATYRDVSTSPNQYISYSCVYFENPSFAGKASDEILSSARDGSLRNVQGTLLDERHLNVDGHPAIDVQARVRNNAAYDMRLVEVGNRLYMLAVVDTRSYKRDAKNIQKFYDSFKTNGK